LNNPEDESSEEEDEESSDDDDGRTVPIRPDASTATLPKEMAGMNLKLGNTEPVQEEETSRAERKAMKKAQAAKEAIQEDNEDEEDGEDDDDLLNPQQATETRQGEKAKAKTAPQTAVPELSRKERFVIPSGMNAPG